MKKTLLSALGLVYIALLLAFFYLPMTLPITVSFNSAPVDQGFLGYLWSTLDNSRISRSLNNSLLIALVVSIITPILSILIAHTIRELRLPRLTLAISLLPLFIPGISMGIATALFFQILDVSPSPATIVFVQVLWSLPFSTLIVLVALSRFSSSFLEASYMLGKNRVVTFFRVELPIIFPGILGAAIFSFILSFNETVRTAVVQGSHNTLQTYLWSQYQQVGLNDRIFNMMTIIILFTLALIAVLAIVDYRGRAKV